MNHKPVTILILLSLAALLFSMFHLRFDLFTHTPNSSGAWQAIGGLATLFATSLLIFQGVQLREDSRENQRQTEQMINAAQAQAKALDEANKQHYTEWGLSNKPNLILADRQVSGLNTGNLPEFILTNMSNNQTFIESAEVYIGGKHYRSAVFLTEKRVYGGVLMPGDGNPLDLPQLKELRDEEGINETNFSVKITYFHAPFGPKRCQDVFEIHYADWGKAFNPRLEKIIEMAEV